MPYEPSDLRMLQPEPNSTRRTYEVWQDDNMVGSVQVPLGVTAETGPEYAARRLNELDQALGAAEVSRQMKPGPLPL
jgi:hypothetical protein